MASTNQFLGFRNESPVTGKGKVNMAQKLHMVAGTWGVRCSFHSLMGLLVATLVVAAVYMTGEGGRWLEDRKSICQNCGESSCSGCNLFSGKWVFDNRSHPLYKEKQCTFMSDQLACEKFGRQDLSYQNWRWQPHQCDLPRSVSFSQLHYFMHFDVMIMRLLMFFESC